MRISFAFILLLLLNSCSSYSPVEIPGFDSDAFKKDRGGCNNYRITQFENLKKQKDLLLGASENQIIQTLGRYDYQILDKKNQKVFVYFLEKGPQCEFIQNPTTSEAMVIYLNSVSLTKEVLFQKGNPQ